MSFQNCENVYCGADRNAPSWLRMSYGSSRTASPYAGSLDHGGVLPKLIRWIVGIFRNYFTEEGKEYEKVFQICSFMVILFLVAGIGFLIAAWRGGATIPAVMDNVIENFKDEETASQYSFGSQGIRKLEIDIGGGNLKIQQGASDEISLENNGKSWVRAEVKDSGETLKIDEGRFASWLRRFWKPRGTAVLTLPENMKLEELDIDCGSGDMTAQNISVMKYRLTAAAAIS